VPGFRLRYCIYHRTGTYRADLMGIPVPPSSNNDLEAEAEAEFVAPPVVAHEVIDHSYPERVLTVRQRKVLQVIRESVQKRGYPPSMREIAEAVGLSSTSSVVHQLRTLQKKGYLHGDPGRPRTVEVRLPGHPPVRPETGSQGGETPLVPGLDIPSRKAIYVPLIGRIAVGEPILAHETLEDVYPLPRKLVGEETLFLLKVVGDSRRVSLARETHSSAPAAPRSCRAQNRQICDPGLNQSSP
jgi:SOS regulatory protein LexA